MNMKIKIIFTIAGLIGLPALLNGQTLVNSPLKNNPMHNRPGVKQGLQQINAANTTTINLLHGRSQAYEWDSVSNGWQWIWQYAEITKYDGKGRIKLDVQIDSVTNDTISKTITSYSTNGSTFDVYYSYQSGVIMQNATLDTTIYDNKENQVKYVYYSLDSTNKWILSTGYIDQLTYDANGNEISDLDIEYNGTWVNNVEDNYTVNAGGSWKTDTTKSWNGIQWVNTSLNDSISWKSWNGINNSQVSSNIGKVWNVSAWKDSVKSFYTYDANGGSIEIDQTLNNDKWVNYSRESQSMDNFGNSTGSTNDTFNGSAWVQTYGEQINYNYDVNNNITQEIDQYYSGSSYVNSNRFVYSAFSTYAGINGVGKSNVQLNVYPNPATETLHLQENINTSENISISICNLQGQVLLVEQINSNDLSAGLNIAVNNFANGIYVLHAISDSQESSQKFIKQ